MRHENFVSIEGWANLSHKSSNYLPRGRGYPTPTQQWRRNGVNLGTSAVGLQNLWLGPAPTFMAGNYDIIVANSQGRGISQTAVLTLLPASSPSRHNRPASR